MFYIFSQLMIPVTPDTLNSMIVAAQAAQNSLAFTSASNMKAEPRSPHRKQAAHGGTTTIMSLHSASGSSHSQATSQLPASVQAAINRLSPGHTPDNDYDETPKAKRSRTNGDEFDT